MPVGNNDIVRGVLGFTMANGDEGKNVFTFDVGKVSVGDWSDSVAAGLVDLAVKAALADMNPWLRLDISWDTLDLYVRVATEWDYLTTVASTVTSSGNSEVMPAGVAALMTAYTELNRVFGRKFIYGVTENAVFNGVLSSTVLTALAAAALDYITPFQGGTMGPLDYLNPGVWSSKVNGFVPFSNVAIVKDTLSYQRRRKSGVGS